MMTASINYTGQLRCRARHEQSSSEIETDAPSDNRGKGARFSPTDLVTVALGTCIITTIGIKAEDMGIDLSGASAAVTKHMVSDPRRIGRIDVSIQLPANAVPEPKDRLILERTGNHCPVHQSLHPDTVLNIQYDWV
jgi:putative redox protein